MESLSSLPVLAVVDSLLLSPVVIVLSVPLAVVLESVLSLPVVVALEVLSVALVVESIFLLT